MATITHRSVSEGFLMRGVELVAACAIAGGYPLGWWSGPCWWIPRAPGMLTTHLDRARDHLLTSGANPDHTASGQWSVAYRQGPSQVAALGVVTMVVRLWVWKGGT